MYDCYFDSPSSWATVNDLYDRFGDEYMDKISTRNNYNSTLGRYVADESVDNRFKVISLALCDAKELIIRKLQCAFSDVTPLNDLVFPAIKQWHIKITIETLKIGGDCSACACNEDLDKFIACGVVCTSDGVCLSANSTFISATCAKFPCENGCGGGCGCCNH